MLREDCNTILKKDRMRLFESLCEESKRAVRLGTPRVVPMSSQSHPHFGQGAFSHVRGVIHSPKGKDATRGNGSVKKEVVNKGGGLRAEGKQSIRKCRANLLHDQAGKCAGSS